jgi:phosphoribosylaminoimidazolecarboxamide formyltransferase/IMP cyclohydrolase
LLARAAALLLDGRLRVAGPLVTIDPAAARAAAAAPRRALLSVTDKAGLPELGAGLVRHGFELVSSGGTARALREAGLPVTDVAAVTGFAEMLDGRVKTLHPRIHAGVLADRRNPDHRAQLADLAIEPFDLVVVNLYPFGAAAERAAQGELDLDGLLEEIDIGGPALVRAAAKNMRNVAIVTSPARYSAILGALDAQGSVPPDLRAALAVEAFRHTAAYDARIAEALPAELDRAGIAPPDEPGFPGSLDPYPPTLTIGLEKVETLRYGENPHQPAARYRRPGSTEADGPFATGEPPLQGKALSYTNILDASAASALARFLRGPACVIVKHTNPCGAAERGSLAAAWHDALAGDPVSAFGGVVGLTREVNREMASRLAGIFLEIVVAPGFDADARAVLAGRPNLRLVVDRRLGATDDPARAAARGAIRSAGGAILVSAPDTVPDDPAGWGCVTRRAPTDRERADMDLAWRLVRGATSNAIVLVRDGMLIGLGAGQTSRVDAARQAVEKARLILGPARLADAACASDAFFPFPDAVEACLAAGVTAFVQPGGSVRDAEVAAAVDAAGATMLVTRIRHFRH